MQILSLLMKAVRERLQIEKKDKKLQNKAVDEVIEEDD